MYVIVMVSRRYKRIYFLTEYSFTSFSKYLFAIPYEKISKVSFPILIFVFIIIFAI